MKIQDVMTRNVVSCRTDTNLGAAGRLMVQGGFGALPVVDTHNRLAGIITDRDIAMAAAARQRNMSHIAVHEAMTENVRSCTAEGAVDVALGQMVQARVRRLPVVDAAGQLIGMLSIDDILLRAVDWPDGVSSAAFVTALRRICSQPSVEPAVDFTDTYVSG